MAEPGQVGQATQAPVIAGKQAAPDASTQSKLRNTYWEMTGKKGTHNKPDKYVAKISDAAKDGEITKKEFEQATGLKMTKRAWLAFTGGNETIVGRDSDAGGSTKEATLAKLLKNMEHFVEYKELTQTPFYYFVQCKAELVNDPGEVFGMMDSYEFSQFAERHQKQIREAYNMILRKNGENFGYLEEEDQITRKMLDDLGAEDGNWLAFLLFEEVYEEMEKDKLRLRGLRKDIEDPLVEERFVGTVFKDYLTEGREITRQDLKQIEDFADDMRDLRAALGPGADAKLLGIDVNDDRFIALLDDLEENPKMDPQVIRERLSLIRERRRAAPSTVAEETSDPPPDPHVRVYSDPFLPPSLHGSHLGLEPVY